MTIPVSAADHREDHLATPKVSARRKALDAMVDDWGEDSFPASDPPGCLPPSLISSDPKLASGDASSTRPD